MLDALEQSDAVPALDVPALDVSALDVSALDVSALDVSALKVPALKESLIHSSNPDVSRNLADTLPDGEPFVLPSGTCVTTEEVNIMRKVVSRGKPLHIYELMLQGMVTFGRGQKPPPRVYFEYENGRREEFNGDFKYDENNPVVAIESVNGGPGMTPDDIVNFENSKPGGLGLHGRGLTCATTLICEMGMGIEVTSYLKEPLRN